MSPSDCPECGAEQGAATCLECFHELLAFENENPRAFGAVHHLTVACFYLQHPSGYTRAALEMWERMLRDALERGTSPKEFLRRASAQFEGAKKARDPKAKVPPDWPKRWSMTVGDVIRSAGRPDIDTYIDRAMSWARATSKTLSARGSVPPPA